MISSVECVSRDNGAYGTIKLIIDGQQPITIQGVSRPNEQLKILRDKVAEAAKKG
jgi:hypothetical protein